MPPRHRDRRHRDLPPNLYPTKRDDGRVYYSYRHPETGKRHGMGYDKVAAIEAAKELNSYFGRGRTLVEKVAQGRSHAVTLGEFVAHYQTKVLPQRRVKGEPLSPRYIGETNRILDRFVEHLGATRPMAAITQGEIAAYLATIDSADAHNQHRIRLVQLWRQAVSDQCATDNLPERIIPRDKGKRQRDRLELDEYKAIYHQARPAIRNAMELALNALQRRTDIHKWRFSDQADGYAYIVQQKSRKHGPSAWLRIPLSLPVVHSEAGHRILGDIIEGCRDDLAAPHLVHERPEKLRKSKEKDHHFQLRPQTISWGFRDARDATGLFDHMPREKRPTFHECISLGAHLREVEQGWREEEIQRLKGHSDRAMTEHYLEGHTWTTVEVPR